ncbi:MAG: hypothetical protein WBP42_13245 [Candidatus Zixiibacteriota bacterium]
MNEPALPVHYCAAEQGARATGKPVSIDFPVFALRVSSQKVHYDHHRKVEALCSDPKVLDECKKSSGDVRFGKSSQAEGANDAIDYTTRYL